MSVVLHTANRMDENPELLANARRVSPYLWLKVCGNGFPPVLGAEHHVHYVLSVGVGHASHLRCSPFYTLTSVVAFVVLGSPGPFFKSPLVAPLARQILAQPVRAGKERQQEQSRAPQARHTLAQPVRAGKRNTTKNPERCRRATTFVVASAQEPAANTFKDFHLREEAREVFVHAVLLPPAPNDAARAAAAVRPSMEIPTLSGGSSSPICSPVCSAAQRASPAAPASICF